MFINFKIISIQTRHYKKRGIHDISALSDLKQKSQKIFIYE